MAVYARVSTTQEEQQTSLIGQKDYYTRLINSRIDYTLAGIYADDGISGTSWKHRGAPALFWDEKNQQPLCKSCHDKKTMTEDRNVEYRY